MTVVGAADFRTFVSGIRPQHLAIAAPFQEVQRAVAGLTKDRFIVGHALSNDLEALLLTHPRKQLRDTAKYKPFQAKNNRVRGTTCAAVTGPATRAHTQHFA